jgi:hypothetical protein
LVFRDAFVDGVDVREVVGLFHFVRFTPCAVLFADELRVGDGLLEVRHHLAGVIAITLFVVVPGEVVSTVSLPVLGQDVLDAHVLVGDDRQPRQYRPNPVLFSDVVRPGP